MYVCIHTYIETVKVLVSHLCPALCNTMICSLPSSSVHGILQASILEWIAIPLSRESSLPRHRIWVFCIAGGFFTVCPPGKPSRSYGNRQTVFQCDLTILHSHKWEFFYTNPHASFWCCQCFRFCPV